MFAIDNVGHQLRRAETLGRHGRNPDHAMSGTLSTQFHAYLRERHPQATREGGAAGATQIALWDRFGLTAEVFGFSVGNDIITSPSDDSSMVLSLETISSLIVQAPHGLASPMSRDSG